MRDSRMATAQIVLELSVSQFSFKPTRCLVLGSCGPGQHKEQAMDAVRQNLAAAGREDLISTLVDFTPPPELRVRRPAIAHEPS